EHRHSSCVMPQDSHLLSFAKTLRTKTEAFISLLNSRIRELSFACTSGMVLTPSIDSGRGIRSSLQSTASATSHLSLKPPLEQSCRRRLRNGSHHGSRRN